MGLTEIQKDQHQSTQSGIKRIQRKRTKGWKMPENTVYVGRPTMWGNPFPCGGNNALAKDSYYQWVVLGQKKHVGVNPPIKEEIIKNLKGKNLACWCKEGEPCHADVLLEIANS